ncbi:hypothetical protein HZR84_12860 [Hyphobacterium sp. CCMP332]|nr:hypothetical protein HZR84_12860 [Hyphobacterium sp. CCMP332]
MGRFFYFKGVEDKNKGNKASHSDEEKEFHEKIEKESPDLTELVFDLFFDKEFKGNIDLSEDKEKHKKNSK